MWRDDWLVVPAAPSYSDLFTGRALPTLEQDGRSVLALRDVFGELPVAALLAD